MAKIASGGGRCIFPGCTGAQHCRGWCKPHYEQQRRGYELRPLLATIQRVCRIDGCERDVVVRRDRLCNLHYTRQRRGVLDGIPPRDCEWCGKSFVPKQRIDARCCCRRCSEKNSGLIWRHNLNGVALRAMLAAQEGSCAFCAKPLEFDTQELHIDHDHACCDGDRACGKCVRWILCRDCNWGLGNFHDNVAAMREAIGRLEAWGVRPLAVIN